jgi:hypothetical protein
VDDSEATGASATGTEGEARAAGTALGGGATGALPRGPASSSLRFMTSFVNSMACAAQSQCHSITQSHKLSLSLSHTHTQGRQRCRALCKHSHTHSAAPTA